MIETETGVLLLETVSTPPMIPSDAPAEAETLVLARSDCGEGSVLNHRSRDQEDEWISLSTLPSTAADIMPSPGYPAFLDPQSAEGDIVITGPRYHYDGELGGGGGTGGGDTTGSGGGGTSGGAGGGGGGATAVEQHQQDCGTEDGAAAQVAKH